MRLEDAAVRIRPRGGWEALDLGFRMARAEWRSLWGIWFAVYLPFALILHLVFHEVLWAAMLLLWWLKPLFDRFLLHGVSRAMFGAAPGARATLGAWREILRPGLFRGLTLHRIDLARSFVLPVSQLEQQRGRAARERRAALGKRMRGYAVWLTVVCAHFEAIVMLSLAMTLVLLAPASADPGFEFSKLFSGGGENDGSIWSWADSLAAVIAVSLIEPFYVAAGFSLYLNRRAVLEGWDIEIALRRLEARLEAARRPLPGVSPAALLAAMLLGLAALAVAPPEAQAAEKQARREIREVLRGREFPSTRQEMTWTLRSDSTEKAKDADSPDMDSWLKLGKWIARIVEGIGWLLAVGIALWLLFKAARYLQGHSSDEGPAWQAPDALFGLSLAPGSLPDDVSASAAALVREGRVREALSLLYRGALSVLVHRDRVPLTESHTEGDCLRAARPLLAAEAADYFGRLVRTWMASAYAGRLPEPTAAEALARDWDAHFGAACEPVSAGSTLAPA